MPIKDEALKLHRDNQGKIEVVSKVKLANAKDLSIAYTPGVAEPCKEIHQNPAEVYTYTAKGNLVAVVSDGSAVLGLGNIGPKAAIPVMEGKALLFKAFAGVDAFPVCLDTQDIDKLVETVKLLEPNFGGINLEDISAPRCFEVEKRLKAELDIPVFHDDQHGTAIVVLAGLINALKYLGKDIKKINAVLNGAGSAGIAITKLLMDAGLQNIVLCDKQGALYEGAPDLDPAKEAMTKVTNRELKKGTLADVIKGADLFIGVSAANLLKPEMVKSMAKDAIIFAMANPAPEIIPDEALAAGAAVVATGRSDFPNQINNVLAFPGIFRGALDVIASDINEAMKVAAAHAIANLIDEKELSPENIIPNPFDHRVAPAVAEAVARAAIDSGVARRDIDPAEVAAKTRALLEK